MGHLVLLGKRGRKCYWESWPVFSLRLGSLGGALAVKSVLCKRTNRFFGFANTTIKVLLAGFPQSEKSLEMKNENIIMDSREG
jgi:hypothetical protein